jgi:hypothetical protein
MKKSKRSHKKSTVFSLKLITKILFVNLCTEYRSKKKEDKKSITMLAKKLYHALLCNVHQ